MSAPYVIILAGPNGAGKSTTAPILLRDTLAVEEFVNADVIAQGLSAFAPDKAALQAGRIMLERMNDLAKKRVNFAFETTLASRTFAPWLKSLQTDGYKTHLLFLSLPSEEFAIQRVASRVHLGGHDIPKSVIVRRFHAGLANFFQRYMSLVSEWKFYDNTNDWPVLIAKGKQNDKISIKNAEAFEHFQKGYANDK